MGMKIEDRKPKILVLVIVFLVIAGGAWVVWRRNIVAIKSDEEADRPSLEELLSLPYLAHVENDPHPELRGVTLHNEALAFEGFNLLTSMRMRGSHLLDMAGNILHSWTSDDSIGRAWLYSEMAGDGSLMAVVLDVGLVRMNWNSDLIWLSTVAENPYIERPRRAAYHHDFEVTANGDVYALATEPRHISYVAQGASSYEICDNSMVILTSQGVATRSISFHDLLGDLMADEILTNIRAAEAQLRKKKILRATNFDVYHCNTVEEIQRDIGVAKKGDVLFCVRNLNLVGIVDIEKEELAWSWGPDILQLPHHPTVLEDGNILVFDNGTRQRKYSRVLEVDPAAKEVVWQYEADPRESFFSPIMGASQRLPNGNTLITESTKGRVFEVTEDGEIVWEFWNFQVRKGGKHKGKRATIYRMIRYGPDYLKSRP